MLRVTSAALAVLLCSACDGGSSSGKADAAAAAKKAPEAKAEDKSAEAAPADEPVASEPPPPSAAELDPLGQRFRDPPWFRPNMFGDKGTKVDFARSEANDAGLFKSHMIFELSEGLTKDDCSKMVTEKLASAVTLTAEEKPNDRIQLGGSTDRYDVTAMCGEADGKMRAYVSYEWTR